VFNKTITKKIAFVISFLFVCSILTNCSFVSPQTETSAARTGKKLSDKFNQPKVIGRIETEEIKESSGLVNSRCDPEILWTHNDSGDGNFIYALTKKGQKLGTWRVTGAKNIDWEDLATVRDKSGNCFLYIGDIGNNSRTRGIITVYKLKEPKVSPGDRASSKKRPLRTEKAEAITLSYPNLRRDAEALLVHPRTGHIYIMSKRFSGASGVYKVSGYKSGKTNTLEQVADVSLPALPNGTVTGAEISPDGKRVIICDYFNGYELSLNENEKSFDDIWEDEPSIIELGKRKQGEAICYASDLMSIFATSEKADSPVIEVRRKSTD
jgi:hypothetical protein